jgi:hypothetical protein
MGLQLFLIDVCVPSLLGPIPKIDAQQGISCLDAFDGIWGGPVERIDADGTVSKLMMVLRMGSMLEGTIEVLEEQNLFPDRRACISPNGRIFFQRSNARIYADCLFSRQREIDCRYTDLLRRILL